MPLSSSNKLLTTLFFLLLLPLTVLLTLSPQETRKQAAPQEQTSSPPPTQPQPEYVPGEILVKFRKGIKIDVADQDQNVFSVSALESKPETLQLARFLKQQQVISLEKVFKDADDPQSEIRKFKQRFPERKINEKEAAKIDLSRTYKLTLPKETNILSKARQLSQVPLIEYAEPNYIFYIHVVPDDPYYLDSYPDNTANRDPSWNPSYDYQWNLKKIAVEDAWDITTGSEEITVAVVDTGIDYTHPELGGCTLDTVKNNTCQLVTSGYDFVNDADGPDDDPMDDNSHGTHVAGLITALSNNDYGIAAINWNIRVMPVKALDNRGYGTNNDLSAAITYAVENGARVINMSWGFKYTSLPQTLKESLDYAHVKDVLLIASAGNKNNDIDFGFWPANYPSVLAVSATDPDDAKAEFSNYGAHIAVAAPGGKDSQIPNIISLKSSFYLSSSYKVGENFLRKAGTSMAAPQVAGLAGLILAKDPTLTSREVEAVIENGADDIEATEANTFSGYGRINVSRSLSDMDIVLPPHARVHLPKFITIGNSASIPITAIGDDFESFTLEYKKSKTSDWTEIITRLTPTSEYETISWETTNIPDGEYTLRLVVRAHQKTAVSTVEVRKDSRVMDNWPVLIPYDFNFPPWEFNRVSVIADIDSEITNDQKDEIVILINEMLHIYSANGSELMGWPKNLSHPELYSGFPAQPVIGDLDPSYPGLEIVILRYIFSFSQETGTGNYTMQILAYHQDGSKVNGFPYSVNARPTYANMIFGIESLILDDITGDGALEILFLADVPTESSMYITSLFAVTSTGQNVPNYPITNTFREPQTSSLWEGIFTGNLSSHPGREILYVKGGVEADYRLTVYDGDGETVKGWPKNFSSFGSGLIEVHHDDILIGDINPSFPLDEIIIQTNKINIISSHGAVLDQKPMNSSGYVYSLLADINQDNILDVFVENYRKQQFDYYSIGTLDGFPARNPYSLQQFERDFFTLGIAADLGNDNKTDFIVPAKFGPFSDPTYGYASYTYNNGELISGPINSIKIHPWPEALTPLALADLNGDHKAEIITATNGEGYFIINAYQTGLELGETYWPQYLNNEQHTGSSIDSAITPTPEPNNCPTWTPEAPYSAYYGYVYLDGKPAPENLPLHLYSPREELVGCGKTVLVRSKILYKFIKALGSYQDFSGMLENEEITFKLDDYSTSTDPATVIWRNDYANHQVDIYATSSCDPDLNCDGTVDINDIQQWRASWAAGDKTKANLDDNGSLNILDYLILLHRWL